MFRKLCKSKIHRATVTDSNLNYEGSLTLDSDLMRAADIMRYEIVQVVNINNGARFETYVIQGAQGTGEVCLNGAAARLGQPGDKVIIISHGYVDPKEQTSFKPQFIKVNDKNKVRT
ncbi:MAG: aspartate 1-decarboxylase [bacterium]